MRKCEDAELISQTERQRILTNGDIYERFQLVISEQAAII